MARLYRPHVPLKVRCQVAARQLKWHDPEMLLRLHRKNYGGLLDKLKADIAKAFGCEVKDLRLDHEPALALRHMRLATSPDGRGLVLYEPHANDPKHLLYRPHGAQFDGSHDVKTRIRGEHGQFSDVALIKRQRRREKPPTAYQLRMAALKEKQRELQKERRRELKKQRGKPTGQGWRSRQLRSKKSPHRFGAT